MMEVRRARAMPLAFLRRRGVDPVEIAFVVSVFGRAEFALHDHATRAVAQVGEFLALQRAQHTVDALAAAAAARGEYPPLEDARPFAMEQPPQQLGRRPRAGERPG